jgi:hypothetical protein
MGSADGALFFCGEGVVCCSHYSHRSHYSHYSHYSRSHRSRPCECVNVWMAWMDYSGVSGFCWVLLGIGFSSYRLCRCRRSLFADTRHHFGLLVPQVSLVLQVHHIRTSRAQRPCNVVLISLGGVVGWLFSLWFWPTNHTHYYYITISINYISVLVVIYQ